jgi:serine phosphatase RsbU (regulator of sigma subunit)
MSRPKSLWRSGGFWRAQGTSARLRLLGAVFFTFSVIGFVTDIWRLDPTRPRWLVIAGAVFSGALAAGYVFAIVARRRSFVVVLVLAQFAGTSLLSSNHPHTTAPLDPVAIHRRLMFDGIGLLVSMTLGYALFMTFIRRDGERLIRLNTEVALAKGIHDRLVPPIQVRAPHYEFLGRADPSSDIGGDLVDLVDPDRRPVVYVADVTGHGIAAGTVASMVKSAFRMGLLDSRPIDAVLDGLNEVIRQLDRPELFVTCAAIAFDSGTARIALAGHNSVLIVPAGSGEPRRVVNRHPPLGVVGGNRFDPEIVAVRGGDLFVMFTDGLIEVANRRGEQLGQPRLEQIVCEHATRPLEDIANAVFDAARRHGAQDDDQTLLLVRAL